LLGCIDSTVYHIGASLKDLGKRWFSFKESRGQELLYDFQNILFLINTGGDSDGDTTATKIAKLFGISKRTVDREISFLRKECSAWLTFFD